MTNEERFIQNIMPIALALQPGMLSYEIHPRIIRVAPTSAHPGGLLATPFWAGHPGLPIEVLDSDGQTIGEMELAYFLTGDDQHDAEEYIRLLKNIT
jgi:hypothetical protein